MQIKDNGSGAGFEQPPTGTTVARCIKVIDLGTQRKEWEGKITTPRQVVIMWELPNELMQSAGNEGKPFTVSKWYTASLSEKANLRADLANWRGRDFTSEELQGFEPKNLIGKTCMVSITLDKKEKARVTGVMALPRGTQVPPQVNESVYFSLDEYDAKVYNSLSDGFKKIIAQSPEFSVVNKGGYTAPPADPDSDIPF